MLPIGSQLEAKQEPIEQCRACSTHEQVSFKLRTQSSTTHETDRRRRQRILPTEFRIEILRSGQHVQFRQCFLRGGADVARRPAKLLKVSGAVSHLNRFKLIDSTHRSHCLDPATVETRTDTIDFIKCIVAILLSPQSAAQRIEVHPETVAYAVGEHF